MTLPVISGKNGFVPTTKSVISEVQAEERHGCLKNVINHVTNHYLLTNGLLKTKRFFYMPEDRVADYRHTLHPERY